MALAIGVDIGGTKIAAGLVDEDGAVRGWHRRSTPGHDVQLVEDRIIGAVAALRAAATGRRQAVVAVGVGAAGFVSAGGARVLFAPHLAWRDEPLQQALQERIDLPVYVDNDANGAAWAEARFGAGRGESRLVCVTLGTGIGGGIVIDGRLERGRYGLAGEFGHMVVVPGGHRCECGNRGCWEQYASGRALGREARALLASGSPSAQPLLDRAGGDPAQLTGEVVTQAATDGDPAAGELVTEVGEWLGAGLANLAAALDPGTFVVGGGVAAAGDLLLEPARAAFARTLTGRGHRPPARIVAAERGPLAGVVGMADLARRAVLDGR